MNNETKITDFIDEFIEAFQQQLESDDKRWGATWLHRTKEGQEDRIRDDYENYWNQWEHAGVPVPWLKIIGNAYIAWIRENHPELFSK